ncbi:phosphatase PAP2 family protein [Helicobacter mustelae]|nr:phosphatase PAP2 family protein [Helicobacter mustelae]
MMAQKSCRMIPILWAIGIVFFALLGLVAVGVMQGREWVQSTDLFFLDLVRNPAPSFGAWLDFVQFSTWFAQSKLIAPIALLIALWWVLQRRLALGLWFFSSVLLGEIALKILKHIFQRPRPATNGELYLAHGFSFPSGHALAAALFYGLLAFLLCFSKASTRAKTAGAVFLLFWIFLMMYDRVYLGVHYPTDVLGGFLLGMGWSCCSMGLYLWFHKF